MIAHETTTGPEILKQIGGPVDGWIAAVGTKCTFIDVAKTLKAVNSATICAAAEPEGSEPLVGKKIVKSRHIVQGIGYGLVPPHWDPELMDMSLTVTDAEVEHWRRQLAVKEGLYVGYSAAANVCAAVKLLGSDQIRPNATVATILCDTGMKY